MSYKHITIFQRNKIEILHQEGDSVRKIAELLGYHHSSIRRELKKCNGEYATNTAEVHARNLSKNKGRKTKLTEKLKEHTEDKLSRTWSPEQIVGRDLEGILSFKTIYNGIYKDLLTVEGSVLRRKGQSRKAKESSGKFNIGTPPYRSVPKKLKNAQKFAPWELDTAVSSRGKSKGCLPTFAEMKTRAYFAIKIIDRSKETPCLKRYSSLQNIYLKKLLKALFLTEEKNLLVILK